MIKKNMYCYYKSWQKSSFGDGFRGVNIELLTIKFIHNSLDYYWKFHLVHMRYKKICFLTVRKTVHKGYQPLLRYSTTPNVYKLKKSIGLIHLTHATMKILFMQP